METSRQFPAYAVKVDTVSSVAVVEFRLGGLIS